jgi:beta-phosphoglucomutase
MIKKGFIFDLDGVIVDTAKYHFGVAKLAQQLELKTLEHNEELRR